MDAPGHRLLPQTAASVLGRELLDSPFLPGLGCPDLPSAPHRGVLHGSEQRLDSRERRPTASAALLAARADDRIEDARPRA